MSATRESTSTPAAGLQAASVLELAGITKTYPGVKALTDVSLTLTRGEIHALLGENGAGKSTLIRIISGVEQPDWGSYRLNGEPVVMRNPRQAIHRGISVVHQERNLVPTFTVGENVLLERVLGRADRWIDRRSIHADARPFMQMVGLHVSPAESVNVLSTAQQQLVEIARALSVKANILLLDEPTASISLREASALLETLRSLRARGTSIIYVSHKLEEVFEVCDTVTVLRDGRNAGPRRAIAGLSRDALIEMMIGRAHVADALPVRPKEERPVVLEVTDRPSEATLVGASFTLHKGEILGWYGLVGSGRTELARAVIGADQVSGGLVKVRGQPAQIRSIAEALNRWQIGYVSENRQHEGLFLIHSIQKNIAAAVWQRLRRRSLDIRTPDVARIVGNLSGGNRQKVSLGKWLAASPDILFIDEPTVGIDIRTKYEIHQLIYRLGEQGTSVVLISSDMPEMIRLADRILVFRAGRIVGDLDNSKAYDEMSRRIMSLIVGDAGVAAA